VTHTGRALLLSALSLAIITAGCGGSSSAPPPAIGVAVTPSSAAVQPGQTVALSAMVNNDSSNRGVNWALSPASGGGTLINVTSTSAIYKAPSSAVGDTNAKVTATAAADPSKFASSSITVHGVSVVVTSDVSVVTAGGTANLTAAVSNDASNQGVTWSISPATGAGTLADATSSTVVYDAPATPPSGDVNVVITATSVTNSAATAQQGLTFAAISISVIADINTVQAGAAVHLTATVTGDPSNQGVTWSLSPTSGGGSLSNATSTSVTYRAPATPPLNNLDVNVLATSVADATRTGAQGITVLAITVAVSPGSALLPTNATLKFTPSVQNDPGSGSVQWSPSQGGAPCTPACGVVAPLNTVTGTAATYTAPSATPANPAVTLTATSTTDGSKTASAALTISSGTVELAPATLDFGRVKINRNTKVLNVVLSNTGGTALSISKLAITGSTQFTETNNCGTSVASAASCTIQVTFKPNVLNSTSATLSITDTSTDSPQQVPLTGFGIQGFGDAVQSLLSQRTQIAVPSTTGMVRVGTRVIALSDVNRKDPYLATGAKRELLVRFWYPASLAHGCQPAPYTSPRVWSYFSTLAGIPLPEVTTNSCLDAEVAEGRHPVVVFTHGYTGTFTDYTFLSEDLAARGYVVASVDHTYEATAVEFPDGRIAKSLLGSHLAQNARMDDEALSFAVLVRLGDLKFVVRELDRLNAASTGPFADKLDTSRVALAGHSVGGLTAILGIEQEPRFKAAVILDGVVPDRFIRPTKTPVLVLSAGADVWGNDNCRLWNHLAGPRYSVNLNGAEHLTPSDAVWLASPAIHTGDVGLHESLAAVRAYTAAFLDANLRGERLSPLLANSWAALPGVRVTGRSESRCKKSPRQPVR
jgi:dienelactone hydrolase